MSSETDANQPEIPAMGDLDPEQAAELEAAMAEARARLLSVPPETVVVNHVMGLYELAAIHLSNTPPDLTAATLAIDSMALLVDGLGDRLGDDAPTMRDALGNIRMAFVAVSNAATGSDPGPSPADSGKDGASLGDPSDDDEAD